MKKSRKNSTGTEKQSKSAVPKLKKWKKEHKHSKKDKGKNEVNPYEQKMAVITTPHKTQKTSKNKKEKSSEVPKPTQQPKHEQKKEEKEEKEKEKEKEKANNSDFVEQANKDLEMIASMIKNE